MSKKVVRVTKSLETIPMDVVILNILVFVYPFGFFPNYSSFSEKPIKDYYGYFRRDSTRKIYYLFRSFFVPDFQSFRHVLNIEKVICLELNVATEEELVQKFFSNSHRARSLLSLSLLIKHYNSDLLSLTFSKEGCFPKLNELIIELNPPASFSPTKLPTYIRRQLQVFSFLAHSENNYQFPLILDTPSLENLKQLFLERVKPKGRLFLKIPKLRILILKHCDNISLETGEKLEEFEVHGMKAEFIKQLFSSLRTKILKEITINTGGHKDQTYRNFTFLFDGHEGRTPLKKFRKLEDVVFVGVEWNNEALGDNERIFPDESLDALFIQSCNSIKRHHVNWSSEKLELILLRSLPLCLDSKVDLKNVKNLMLHTIEGLTDDFFRDAKFEKLEEATIWGYESLAGIGWDESMRSKLKELDSNCVDVNRLLNSGDFLSLENVLLSANHRIAAKWGNLPSLRIVECTEEFFQSLKECNKEGNIDFGRLEWRPL